MRTHQHCQGDVVHKNTFFSPGTDTLMKTAAKSFLHNKGVAQFLFYFVFYSILFALKWEKNSPHTHIHTHIH